MRVTKGNVDLAVPPDAPSIDVWRYGIGIPFQLTSNKAALFCNIHTEYAPTYDLEVGTDLIIFDDALKLCADQAIPINRNHEEINPNTKTLSTMVKYPIRGGFVPKDAKRNDGSPHPYAGTGFGISQVIPMDAKTFEYDFANTFLELYQFAYDGKDFHILNMERVLSGNFPGLDPGLTSAIPDGDDLLFATNEKKKGVGVSRWKHNGEGWYRHSFSSVTRQASHEPSLVRDVDGALLFSSRVGVDITVWRSRDGVSKWKRIINRKGLRSNSPVTLNQTADGIPYIASNLYQEIVDESREIYSSGAENSGREMLGIWPLKDQRTDLDPAIVVRNCRDEFGPPPGGSFWVCDHPSAATVRLSDGKWHNLLAYRVLEHAEIQRWWRRVDTEKPTPMTGSYVEEVHSSGNAIPVWNF